MRDIRNILACRLSSDADGALEAFAADLARAHGARLHFAEVSAAARGADIGPALGNGGGTTPSATTAGAVARMLRERASSVPVDLVVLPRTCRGAGGAAPVGTAGEILREAGVPVLTVPRVDGPGADVEAIETVLVPADLSDPGDPALDAGRQLATRLDAGLLLLDVTGLGTWLGGLEGLRGLEPHSVPAEEVAQLGDVRTLSERARIRLQERLAGSDHAEGEHRDSAARREVSDGVELLLGFIGNVEGCLTVVSREGLQSMRRPFGPSVADALAEGAPCPVLMVESGRAAAPVSLSIRKSA
jgi:nucleotide-binding universal stress UspA family protein